MAGSIRQFMMLFRTAELYFCLEIYSLMYQSTEKRTNICSFNGARTRELWREIRALFGTQLLNYILDDFKYFLPEPIEIMKMSKYNRSVFAMILVYEIYIA